MFDFFSAAENLEALTPPFLLAGSPRSASGDRARFVDVQLRGPYRTWHHLYEFREVSYGTEMRDVVDYELPLGPLGDLANALAVKRTLSRIFAFRRQAVDSAFPPR